MKGLEKKLAFLLLIVICLGVPSLLLRSVKAQSQPTYFYVVTAVDAQGNESVFSNQASATIPATPPPHSVGLTWTASTSTVVGYNIYRGTTSGGPYVKVNTTTVVATNFTDTSFVPNPPQGLVAVPK
jgi:hypothetical protein